MRCFCEIDFVLLRNQSLRLVCAFIVLCPFSHCTLFLVGLEPLSCSYLLYLAYFGAFFVPFERFLVFFTNLAHLHLDMDDIPKQELIENDKDEDMISESKKRAREDDDIQSDDEIAVPVPKKPKTSSKRSQDDFIVDDDEEYDSHKDKSSKKSRKTELELDIEVPNVEVRLKFSLPIHSLLHSF